MNARTTILLVVILLVLGAVATLTESNRKKQWAPGGAQLFPGYAKDRIDAIDLTKGNIHVRMTKQDGEWLVETEKSKPADPALVEAILEGFEGLSNDDLVSSQADSHPALEVDSTGVEVAMGVGGAQVVHVIVGKPGPDFMSTYLRPAKQDQVYRVPVYLRTQVDRGDQTWRDKVVLKVPQSEITSYTTTDSAGARMTIALDETGQWRVSEPQTGAARADLIPVMLQSMANIQARDFADSLSSLADAGLDPPRRTLDIETKDGERYRVEIGAETDARQNYVRRQGRETVFLVPAGRWNTIFRPVSDLLIPDETAPTEELEGEGDNGSGQ